MPADRLHTVCDSHRNEETYQREQHYEHVRKFCCIYWIYYLLMGANNDNNNHYDYNDNNDVMTMIVHLQQ